MGEDDVMTRRYKKGAKCTVVGCENEHVARGFCNAHYLQGIRNEWFKPSSPVAPPETRLLRKLARNDATGCLEWNGALKNGYGVININRRMVKVYDLAYQLWVGEWADGWEPYQKCGNKLCCEPVHLGLRKVEEK